MRKLTLIAATALTATALITTTAHAQGGVEVVHDGGGDDGNPCGEVTVDGNQATGGCLIEATGRLDGFYTNPSWWDACQSHLSLRISTTGDVYAPNPAVYSGGSQCYAKACENEATDEAEMWTGAVTASPPPYYDTNGIDLDICIESSFGGTHYPIEMSGELSSGPEHAQTDISIDGTLAYPASNWSGEWTSDDEIEIIDL